VEQEGGRWHNQITTAVQNARQRCGKNGFVSDANDADIPSHSHWTRLQKGSFMGVRRWQMKYALRVSFGYGLKKNMVIGAR
jgi:hypothetical protein